MKVAALSGGVGGARMLRGLAALDDVELTAIVNVGDDDVIYGLHISPDIDTVVYTLADIEGPQGWGRAGDSHQVMKELERFPIDTWFLVGDLDMATHLFRTARLGQGWTLSQVTTAQSAVFGGHATVVPATDDPVRTELHVPDQGWISFQDYFVDRHHAVEVDDVRFNGASSAVPAPGVVEAIQAAEVVVIGPSNPPLSIWPILAVPGVAEAVGESKRVVGVSPLFGGRPLKGPTDRVMAALGLPDGTAGVLAAYDGLLTELVIDSGDVEDEELVGGEVVIRSADTRMSDLDAAAALAAMVLQE